MRAACRGGGPAGLYFAISLKLKSPDHEVTVFERNQPDSTFGWGVVLSDETLENLTDNDPVSAADIRAEFSWWDDIAVHYRGTKTVSGGHGFCGIGRKKLLQILHRRANQLGIDLRFGAQIDSVASISKDYDVVVGCDGLNSGTRGEFDQHFGVDRELRTCKFVWLGTTQKFNDAFTFIFEETDQGWIWAHAYQFDDDTATFIIECSEQTFDNFGFGALSQQESIAVCEEIFSEYLGGHPLMSNADHIRGSAWINFPKVLCENWFYDNVVLMGDAAATAHFSIGSGTKLALESAIELANAVTGENSLKSAFARYQAARRVEVLRLQSAARNSLEWFEEIDRYLDLDPVQFNYSLLTRSQRISHENLRNRDPDWLRSAESWFQDRAHAQIQARDQTRTLRSQIAKEDSNRQVLPVRAPMFAPYRLRDLVLGNRIVVSPMAQYKAADGCPTDWHLVHYGERAKGGAAMVMTEMTCVSPEGRITPGCTGLYNHDHELAWKRIVEFVHRETTAATCCQIGHSGAKGSTQLGWEQMDAPLASNNWPLIAASSVAWSDANQRPREMDSAAMEQVIAQFVSATEMALRAGFDMIELHMAHGYLLSSFITPLTNRRSDDYGGSLDNRLRFPLRVFEAVRTAWPAEKPISARISANDWVGEAGVTPDDAVEIAKRLKQAGVDICNVSAGQTSVNAQPRYGRMFQTPFSDQIRNLAHIPTMAVGNIYEPDHVNSILMAGRADLVCLGRPHLSDPYWTRHAAAELGEKGLPWPSPYLAGGEQLNRLVEREREAAGQEPST